MQRRQTAREMFVLVLLTAAALLIQGYHAGVEDQAIYLPAIKKNLDPTLYPHDAAFFLNQAGPTLFDELISETVRWAHLPVEIALFAWHVLSIFLLLLASRQLSRRIFSDPVAQWAAVTMTAVMLALPVAGTLLRITAEYLHPRNLATAALLFALVAVLDRKATALAWLAVSAVLHPQMAVFGAFHLAVQAWRVPASGQALAALSFPRAFLQAGDAWRAVLETRTHHFPLRWKWYEQAGAIAPLVLLAWFAHMGKRAGNGVLAHVSGRMALSGGLGVAGAVAITLIPGQERLIRAQSMRSLHLVYLLLVLVGGGLLGQFVLRNRLRWILLFVPLAAAMFCGQMRLYPSSAHVEWPGAAPTTAWTQAFDWIRQNTPQDALFALDPRYMERPGEDFHGFRALAERSMLADYTKDRGVAALFPELAETWREQMQVRGNWSQLTAGDFRRLKERFGVAWVVLERPGVPGLACPYVNEAVMVCRVE